MNQTYSQIAKKIAKLQQEAEKVRQREIAGVVERIKVAIATYGLAAEQLFGAKAAGSKGRTSTAKSSSAKYSDGNGNVWVGRGPRPLWLREALASGRQLSDFLVGASDRRATPAVTGESRIAKKAARRRGRGKQAVRRKAAKASSPSRVKYTDGTNTWSGHGRQPRWLKDAVASGKSLDELRTE